MIANRRSLWVASLLAFALALGGAAHAQVNCAQYIDSRSGSSGGITFCWLSGSICYDCWSGGGSQTCSSNWNPCDPRPRGPFVQTAALPSPAPQSSVAQATAPTAAIRFCEVTSPGPTLRSETLF